MQKRGLLLTTGLLLAVGASIVTIVITRPPTPISITVSFIGYQTNMAGVSLARFAVTNCSDVTIKRWGVFHPESQQKPGLLPTVPFGPSVFLSPGQSEIIAVPFPTNQGPWRAVFDISREGFRRKFSDWAGGSPLLPQRFRGVPVQFERSEWIAKNQNSEPAGEEEPSPRASDSDEP